MPAWPWPRHEVDYVVQRARLLLGDDAEAVRLVSALLDTLAVFGDVADKRHGDVTDLRKWAKRQTATRLTAHLRGADALAVAAGEAGRRHRRGDLVHAKRAPWPAWNGIRDH